MARFKVEDTTLHDVRGLSCNDAITALEVSWDRACRSLLNTLRDMRGVKIRPLDADEVLSRAMDREVKAARRLVRYKRLANK